MRAAYDSRPSFAVRLEHAAQSRGLTSRSRRVVVRATRIAARARRNATRDSEVARTGRKERAGQSTLHWPAGAQF
jgi:hypothetical protein